jgi:hypothetical protein
MNKLPLDSIISMINFAKEIAADCSHNSQSLHQERRPVTVSFPY